jgi:hypothetical protein
MVIKREDILAVRTEKDLACRNCASDQDLAAVEKVDQLVTAASLGKSDALVFCDRCANRIKASEASARR